MHMWMPPPTPVVPVAPRAGLALSQAISSFRSFGGRSLLPMIQSGPIDSSEIGWKSSTKSNGIEYITLPPTCDVHCPTISV